MIEVSMQTKKEQKQTRMTLLPPLEEYIPDDHPIRRLNRVLDLSYIHEALREYYCQDNGRPSVDPEVIIRLFLLQAIEGIVHVRELMRQVQVNLAYRWFIGYELDEKLPDHSTLSRALDRFGDEIFNELFERSIKQCKKSGLIEGKLLHVDATTIRADLDRDRVDKLDSPDKDARYGHFPDGTIRPGYKQHTVADSKRRVIVGLSVTAADVSEHSCAVEVIYKGIKNMGGVPEAVGADGVYASGRNNQAMIDRGIRLVSPPPKLVKRMGCDYFTVEDFIYNSEEDVFICPAGAKLRYVSSRIKRQNRRRYRGPISACVNCPLKSRCTNARRRVLEVGEYHAAMVRLRADSKTDDFRKIYSTRAPVIEGVFAEAKQWHGLGRAWRRGLSKMRIQCLLIAAVINFKRLAGAIAPSRLSKGAVDFIFVQLYLVFSRLRRLTSFYNLNGV